MKFFKLLLCSICAVSHLAVTAQSKGNDVPELATNVVTANKYPEDPLKLAAFVTVLTQEDLKRSGVRTVNEALMSLGGVLGRKSLFGGNEFSLDLGGFGEAAASNFVFVIDGVAFKQGDSGEIRISNISLDEVERIEIQRGGSSVLYGEGAVGGVINIITHSSGLNSKSLNAAKLEAGFGSYGYKDVKASTQYSRDGLRLFASGAKGESNGFRENSASNTDNASLAIQMISDNARVGGSVSNNNEFARTPGGLTMAKYLENRNQANATNLSLLTLLDSNSKHYGAFSEIDFNGIIWRNDIKRRERNYFFLENKGGYPTTATYTTKNDTYSTNLNQGLPTRWGKYTFLMGLEKNNWTQLRNDASFGLFDNVAYSNSFFLKNEIDFSSSQTRLTAGYRVEDMFKDTQGRNGGKLYITQNKAQAWELGVTQFINSNQSVWAKLSTNYRLPNLDEIISSYGRNDDLSYTEINLNPQTSLDKEVGWHYVHGKGDVNFRLFQSNLKNEIAYDENHYTNINLDPTKREGVDISVRQRLTSSLDIGGFATYKHSRFVEGIYEGHAIPLSPDKIYSFRANWKFASAQSFGLIVVYTGSQQIGSDYTNIYSMPSYRVTDISYQHKLPNSEFQVSVKNVFNKDYYSYATTNVGSIALYPDIKRSVYAVYKHYLN
ncbi:MAG: TonB-dependent receptor [Betaproteobacteria bacterium]|nr:TonB-dependent receptor [Betaproteobacteria bacterium]